MSYLLTEDLAKRAVEMVLPSVMQLMEDGTFKRRHLHIIVARRARYAHDEESFQKDILYKHDIGNRDEWESPFDEIAYNKCFQSWRTGLSTYEIQTISPQLLEVGDSTYYGSVVGDGVAVGGSAVQPYFDEMTSDWVRAAIKALCKQGRGEMKADDNGFIR